MSQSAVHTELRRIDPGCTYDMNDNPDNRQAIGYYLTDLTLDVLAGKVRHVSLSVHRVEPEET